MGIMYLGERKIYIEDSDGTVWDTHLKQRRLNRDGTDYVESVLEKTTATITPEPVTKTVTEPVTDDLKCSCGFTAKSKAGLAVHRMHNKHDSITTADFNDEE